MELDGYFTHGAWVARGVRREAVPIPPNGLIPVSLELVRED